MPVCQAFNEKGGPLWFAFFCVCGSLPAGDQSVSFLYSCGNDLSQLGSTLGGGVDTVLLHQTGVWGEQGVEVKHLTMVLPSELPDHWNDPFRDDAVIDVPTRLECGDRGRKIDRRMTGQGFE